MLQKVKTPRMTVKSTSDTLQGDDGHGWGREDGAQASPTHTPSDLWSNIEDEVTGLPVYMTS